MNPVARKTNILVEQLPDEAVVYDKKNHRAHSLNATVFTVWENADGTRTIDQLADLLNHKLQIPYSRELVLLALKDLQRCDLLQTVSNLPPEGRLPSRRELGRKLGLAGAAASMLPFVGSITAPTPAMARSYTASTYQQELSSITESIKKTDLKGNKIALANYKACRKDGEDGLKASRKGKQAAAAAEFEQAETEFNAMLKALGLPPL